MMSRFFGVWVAGRWEGMPGQLHEYLSNVAEREEMREVERLGKGGVGMMGGRPGRGVFRA
jgi:hypothetical protein